MSRGGEGGKVGDGAVGDEQKIRQDQPATGTAGKHTPTKEDFLTPARLSSLEAQRTRRNGTQIRQTLRQAQDRLAQEAVAGCAMSYASTAC
jgi:hypothetical protein